MSAELQHSVSVRKGTLRFLRLFAKAFGVASRKGNVSPRLLELSRRGDYPSEIRVFSRDPAQEKRRIRLCQKATARQGSAALQDIRAIRAIRGGIIWAAFPHRAFGKRDRRAKGPRSDRV